MTQLANSPRGTTNFSIGEVLAELRADFPDTTISKLRFLESEGLVEPERTPAGYRKYSRGDIARLRYILTAQRDHYLPLRVIREHLEAIDNGLKPPAVTTSARRGQTEPTAGDFSMANPSESLSRTQLMELAELGDAELRQIEQFGLVVKRKDGSYHDEAIDIARAVTQLSAFGVEPRHLRAYRAAADREVGLFAQLLAPLARQRDGSERAKEIASELAALSVRLHSSLVRAGLRTTLGDT